MQSLFKKIGHALNQYDKIIIAVITVLTVIFAVGLSHIEMKMGNDVFVENDSTLFKDSTTYQKKFGGDSVYMLLSGSQKDIVSHETMNDIYHLSQDGQKIKNIRGSINIVDLLNDQLKTQGSALLNEKAQDPHSMQKIQAALINSMSAKQKNQIMQQVQGSLTPQQQIQIKQFVPTILTAQQKQSVATNPALAANPNALLGQLSIDQKNKVQKYTLSILNQQQKTVLAKSAMQNLPPVQDMSTELLQAIILSDNGNVRATFQQFLPKNGKNAVIVLNTSHKVSEMNTDVKLFNDLNKTAHHQKLAKNVKIRTAGTPLIMGQVRNEVIKNMGIMLVLAVIIMIVVLAIVFKVKHRLLPLGVVLVCLIWTFGIMGWFNIPITLATMATLPIIIGIGTDFGVQFLNRYDEEFRKQGNNKDAIVEASSQMGISVGVALIVMAFAFLTMYLSKAPLMQEFGLTLAIGVICSYLVEYSLNFSILSIIDKNRQVETDKPKVNHISNALSGWETFVAKHSGIILIIGIVIGAAGFMVEKNINVETSLDKMIPQSMSTVQDTKYLEKQAGSTTYITYMVKDQNISNPKTLREINRIGNKVVKHNDNVTAVTSIPSTMKTLNTPISNSQSKNQKAVNNIPTALRQSLINRDDQYTAVQFKVKSNLSSNEKFTTMNNINHYVKQNSDLNIKPAGNTDLMLKGIDNITANHNLIIVAGLAIIFIILLLIYHDFMFAVYPVLPILLVLGASPLTLFLSHTSYNPVTMALSSLVLGIGTEFTILILERYREEKLAGADRELAINQAIKHVGSAITVSGLTVIGGFSAIIFSSFPVLRSFGAITVLDTAYSLISALTILPAIIIFIQKFRNKFTKK